MKNIVLLLIVLSIVIFAANSAFQSLLVRDVPSLRVEIPKGVGTRTIAHRLKTQGVIGSEWLFILEVKSRGIDRNLKPGDYRFTGRTTIDSVIRKLLKGQNELIRVTIPEGLTIEETADIIQKCGVGNRDLFLKLASDSAFATDIVGFPVPTLEGFLYPETYMMPANLKEEAIAKIMVNQFHKTSDGLLKKANRLGPYQTVILASIIEREAKIGDEKPIMAGVYLNRLKRGQRMEACPTVLYALSRVGIHKDRLLYTDLDIESPFNTYRHTGLPPAPICSPAASTIQAVCNPKNSDFLYFHTDGATGRHIFTRTLKEHNATRAH
jgi:UPF0755 protein